MQYLILLVHLKTKYFKPVTSYLFAPASFPELHKTLIDLLQVLFSKILHFINSVKQGFTLRVLTGFISDVKVQTKYFMSRRRFLFIFLPGLQIDLFFCCSLLNIPYLFRPPQIGSDPGEGYFFY